jgi:hypothetical protein
MSETFDVWRYQQVMREVFDQFDKVAEPFDPEEPDEFTPPGVATRQRVEAQLRARGVRGFRVTAEGGYITVAPYNPEDEDVPTRASE